MSSRIPFNKPYIAGKELFYVAKAVTYGNIAGDGHFTQLCSQILEQKFGIPKVLLTTSCTSALEMATQLCALGPGDEVILPSYTFVSTASSIALTGATPVFVDIREDTLNINEKLIEAAITPNTKAIVPVHYAGVGCAMDEILAIADGHDLLIIEDAAQGVNARYKGRSLGSIGHLGTYSFHETKNYVCGEGGALCLNDIGKIERAEILRDKGTNRKKFFRGQVDKYTWVDLGSSWVISEILSAFLAGQLEMLDEMAERRRQIYERYATLLSDLEARDVLRMPRIPAECETNYHMFYVLLRSQEVRDELLSYLRTKNIHAAFHYVPLHSSPMGRKLAPNNPELPQTDSLSARLLRLPFYYELEPADQDRVIDEVTTFLSRVHV